MRVLPGHWNRLTDKEGRTVLARYNLLFRGSGGVLFVFVLIVQRHSRIANKKPLGYSRYINGDNIFVYRTLCEFKINRPALVNVDAVSGTELLARINETENEGIQR